MKIRLQYIHPLSSWPTETSVDVRGEPDWLHSMVEMNPDTIFFGVTDTTDIFEEN